MSNETDNVWNQVGEMISAVDVSAEAMEWNDAWRKCSLIEKTYLAMLLFLPAMAYLVNNKIKVSPDAFIQAIGKVVAMAPEERESSSPQDLSSRWVYYPEKTIQLDGKTLHTPERYEVKVGGISMFVSSQSISTSYGGDGVTASVDQSIKGMVFTGYGLDCLEKIEAIKYDPAFIPFMRVYLLGKGKN